MLTQEQSKRVRKGVFLYSLFALGSAVGCIFSARMTISDYQRSPMGDAPTSALLCLGLGSWTIICLHCIIRIIKATRHSQEPIQPPETTRGK
jgi:hypothetical protein